jgi:hypothetical protein
MLRVEGRRAASEFRGANAAAAAGAGRREVRGRCACRPDRNSTDTVAFGLK